MGAEPTRLLDLVGGVRRAAIVFNACDHFEERLRNYAREEKDLLDLGFSVEELDLRTYVGAPKALKCRLAGYDLLWVVGGNAFVLARAMGAAGFAQAATQHVRSNRLTYAGYSAGVCVTGPDLDGIHLMNDPDVVASGDDSFTPASGLGWVPWRIIPHWQSDHPEAPAAELATQYLAGRGLAHRQLRDGEVLIVKS